jgi:hypothetical protein
MRPECACKSTAEDVTQRTTEVLRYRAHFSGLCTDEQPRKTSCEAIKHEKLLTVPQRRSAGRVCLFEFTDEFKAWLSTRTLLGASVHGPTFFAARARTSAFLSCHEQAFRGTTDEWGRH